MPVRELTLQEMIRNVMKAFPGAEFYKPPLFGPLAEDKKKPKTK